MPVNVQGFILIVVSVGLLAGLDGFVKVIAASGMHPIEIVFFRNFVGLIVLIPFFMRVGFSNLRTKRLGFHVVRGFVHATAMTSWFWALTLVPLAEATSLSFMMPVYASIGAILFMGELSRPFRWLSIALGFVGMVIILRPGFAEINIGMILVSGSAVAVAITKLMIKSLARTDAPTTIVGYMTITLTIITFVPALFVWTWPSPEIWLWLIGFGAIGSGAHVIMTFAYKIGDITALEPASFTRLIWAALIGFMFFGELPGIWTWIGTAVIMAGSLLLMHDETKEKSDREANT